MTELKTLKDINPCVSDQFNRANEAVNIQSLRLEAVKWIKRYKTIKMRETSEELFMSFFNLTEEDLK